MSSKRNHFKLVRFLATFVFFLLAMATNFKPLSADELLIRSVALSSSFANEVVNHRFRFTTVTASDIGSIHFQYCSNSPLFSEPCVAPTGLDVSSAGIVIQTGLTGFSVSGVTDASNIILTRAPVAEAPVAADFNFSNITNPTADDRVQYVRITVYDDINGTGSIVDRGSVVYVVEDRFNVELFVPPYLTFCVGVSVAINCSSVEGFLADFGEFNRFVPVTATTQMSAATNDPDGYNIFANGATMTSGTNIIPALATPTASQPGTSQFGINLRANSNPSVGANINTAPNAVGIPAPNYNIPNSFLFVNGNRIAGASSSTSFNRYTISYIVNVSENQSPGVYATTLSYTAIASF